MTKIEEFIKSNDLSLDGSGSNLNGNCVVIAGYALHLELTLLETLLQLPELDHDVLTEFERVFNYAELNDYGAYWTTAEAKKMYKF